MVFVTANLQIDHALGRMAVAAVHRDLFSDVSAVRLFVPVTSKDLFSLTVPDRRKMFSVVSASAESL